MTNWSSSLGGRGGGQPDDLVFGLSKDMATLDVGKRHLDNKGIKYGRYQDDEEKYKLDVFWTISIG